MAERDWRTRDELPAHLRADLPEFCDGRYVPPDYDWSVPESDPENPEPPVEGSASYMEADRDKWIRLQGGVQLRHGDWRLETESAFLDREANRVSLPLGVVMRSSETAVKGEAATIDMGARRFDMESASFLMYAQHARGSAGRIYSEDRSTLRLDNGAYTTCAPGDNAWNLTARRMVLDQARGEGRATSMVLWVKGVPVMYFPYLAFPIDDQRRSGFLYPSLTNSNTGRGIDLTVPYYFNLAPNADATYAPRFINGRGLFSELELRHLLPISKSAARLGYIAQDREYENSGVGADGRRWAIDFVNETRPASGWVSRIDINAVSDQNYLRDLNRTLEIAEESHIRRSWTLQYDSRLNFRSRVQAYQTIDRNIAPVDRPYLLLPQLNLGWSKLWRGFTFDIESEYTYFWRNADDLAVNEQITGSRLRTRPSLSYPVTSSWGYLTPSLRLDHTDYLLENDRTDAAAHQSRSVPFVSVDSGLYFDRQLGLFDRLYNQSLEPRLFYVASGTSFQDDLPNFDTSVATFSYSRLYKEDRFVGGDRVGDNNRLTVGLTTRLNDLDHGLEILRASIGRIFYFDGERVALQGQGANQEDGSPIAGELIWRPNERMDVKIEGQWSEEESRTDRGSSTVSFHDDNYETLINLSHRYDVSNLDQSENLEQTEVSGLFTVTPSVALLGRWLFDLTNHRTIGLLGGVEYSSCCWRMQFLVRDALIDAEDSQDLGKIDRGYFLRFELRGLGSLSNRLEEVLANEMPNYGHREDWRLSRFQW